MHLHIKLIKVHDQYLCKIYVFQNQYAMNIIITIIEKKKKMNTFYSFGR